MREIEIIQYRQIEGLTVFLNTVDYRTPHVHPEWELLWVLDQSLSVTSEQSQFVVEEGNFVLFSPNSPHEFHKEDQSCTFMCLQISPKQVPFIKQVVDGRFPNRYLSEQQISTLKKDMKETAVAYFEAQEHYELRCFGKVCQILYMLLSNLPGRVLTPKEAANIDKRNARLKRMIQFVDENYMHKIRLSDFAEMEQCSMSYLSHFVKEATNMTFQEYVNSVRFNCARKLIAAGDRNMLDICMESGFSDYRYFVRAFRQQYGMTPEEYSKHTRQMQLDSAVIQHSLHSSERIYTRAESLKLLSEIQ